MTSFVLSLSAHRDRRRGVEAFFDGNSAGRRSDRERRSTRRNANATSAGVPRSLDAGDCGPRIPNVSISARWSDGLLRFPARQ